MSIDSNEPERSVIDVPERVLFFASEDGRVFIDAEAWVAGMHGNAHDMQFLTELMAGEEFFQGQHTALLAMHSLIDDMREDLNLPPLTPVPDASEAPSDEPEALAEVIDLETAFNLPSVER